MYEAQRVDLKNVVTAIVYCERAIYLIVSRSHSHSVAANECRSLLFYHLLAFLREETESHSLVRKFLYSSLELLGRRFIPDFAVIYGNQKWSSSRTISKNDACLLTAKLCNLRTSSRSIKYTVVSVAAMIMLIMSVL